MSNQNQLRGMLEAMKELKSEYYVGSQKAFTYLQEMRWYETILREVNESIPTVAQKFNLTVKKVAWLVPAIREILQYYWNMAALHASSPKAYSLSGHHKFANPCEYRSMHSSIVSNDDAGTYSWFVDYNNELQKILKIMFAWSKTNTSGVTIPNLSLLIRVLLEDGHICPVFTKTGELVCYNRFVQNGQFRETQFDEFWITIEVWCELDKGSDQNIHLEERELLRQAMQSLDFDSAHSVLKDIEIRQHREIGSLNARQLQCMLEADLIDAEEWLYDRKLYDRADCEKTLGRYEVERRIALNLVHSFQANNGIFESPKALVVSLAQYLKDALQKSVASVRYLRDLDAPSSICKNSEALEKRHRYNYLAVHQNQNWLIDFLSR